MNKLLKQNMMLIIKFLILTLTIYGFSLIDYVDVVKEINKLKFIKFYLLVGFIILPVIFFPMPILYIVAILILGPLNGSLLASLGVVLNTGLMFIIPRWMLIFDVNKLLSKYKLTFDKLPAYKLILLRLSPVPYNILNLLAIHYKGNKFKYLFCTYLGTIPYLLVYSLSTDLVIKLNNTNQGVSLICILIFVFIILLWDLNVKK